MIKVLRGAMWKRTMSYTNVRKRSRQLRKLAALGHNEIVFDHGPKEFPVATLRVRGATARTAALLGDLQRWLAERWSWLRPRSLPVLLAAAGTLAVMLSADFLAHDHGHHLQPRVEQAVIHIVP